jgi:Flp pilus assembly protein TadG
MKRFRFLSGASGEKGAVAPIVALGLLAFVGFMALGIDLGQLYMVRNELQNVADAAALAAVKQLIQGSGGSTATIDCVGAVQAAKDCAKKNYSLGVTDGIKITDADVSIGLFDLNTKTFSADGCPATAVPPNNTQVNAVRVRVHRDGTESNPKVATFFGNIMGAGKEQESHVEAVACMGLAGTSSIDPPITIPSEWAAGGGPRDNPNPQFTGLHRILDKIGPGPAYAALPQTYKFFDKGGSNLDTTRATFIVPQQSELSLTQLQKYIKGPGVSGGLRFPQKKVGDRVWPISEWQWGSNIKSNYNLLKTRYNANKDANGKWRVTLPVYKTTPVTSAVPQDSFFKLASRLIPGVSQAYACAAYTTPAVYTQGFVNADITAVICPSDCTTGDQTEDTSCRKKCYAQIEPVNSNTFSTDKTSASEPFQKDYQDMNPAATKVGVFSGVPKIVK